MAASREGASSHFQPHLNTRKKRKRRKKSKSLIYRCHGPLNKGNYDEYLGRSRNPGTSHKFHDGVFSESSLFSRFPMHPTPKASRMRQQRRKYGRSGRLSSHSTSLQHPIANSTLAREGEKALDKICSLHGAVSFDIPYPCMKPLNYRNLLSSFVGAPEF